MRACRVFGIAMLAGLSAQAEECAVTVVVQYKSISRGPSQAWDILRAELAVSALFHRIGVKVRWQNVAARNRLAGNWNADDGCGAPMAVQLETDTPDKWRPGAMAYAAPYANSGTSIHVFLDRVATSPDSVKETLFAYTLAHEITHVLEGFSRHSADGVMKAFWDNRDQYLMAVHRLAFAPEDVELIHLGIARGKVRGTAVHGAAE